MPSAHAKLSPSSAERWISCPASIRMGEKVPRQGDSVYAREGTLAHALGELKAGLHFGLITAAQHAEGMQAWTVEFTAEKYPEDTLVDMETHTDTYVQLIEERLAAHPGSFVLLEQRLDTGVERCWGTSDTVIVGPDHVEIIDFKYGAGVRVRAWENSQLRLYALGALDAYGDILATTKTVIMTVHQPRMDNVDSETLSADQLRKWREDIVRPAAALALTDDAPFGPSEEACRWCPVAGVCKVRMEKVLQEDFGSDPELISAEELGEVLKRVPGIKKWLSSVEASALDRAYGEGEYIPGWKVVRSGGQRKITDGTGAIQLLIDKGYKAEQVADFKPKGIGVLEKLLGKKEFPVVLAGYIGKTEGKESLVEEHDKRPAISPASGAAADFAGVAE